MMQNRKIAVTGGIGSGKSTFCNVLRERGCAVVSCDEISNELWGEEEYLRGLARLFPSCVEDGKPQKKLISSLVFSNRAALETLNAYAHPRIMERLLSRMQAYHVAIAEVPLLFEGGNEALFDAVVVVRRSEIARIHDAAMRDGSSEEEVRQRIRVQADTAHLDNEKYIIVENDGTLADLAERADEIIAKLDLA